MTGLEDEGLKLNRITDEFLQSKVQYCRQMIDRNGLHHKTQHKVDAVVNAPPPENIS